jgi:hypothetical protein
MEFYHIKNGNKSKSHGQWQYYIAVGSNGKKRGREKKIIGVHLALVATFLFGPWRKRR